jgi:hypothetical protein
MKNQLIITTEQQAVESLAVVSIHPSLDWIANKVWGRDYEDCYEDECLLVDQAKVSKHGYIILRNAKLRNAKLKRADLEVADLEGADLEGADLRHANLRHANLRGAQLCDADLEVADLEGADLEGADLIWARLCKADLRKADLVRANLSEANLEGATIADGYTLTTRRSHQISGVGSEDDTLELYHCHQGWYAKRSCFSGSLPEFLAAVDKKHGDNEHGKRYRAIVAALCV